MSRALGYSQPGESQQELDHIASEDQRLAQQGILMLRNGSRFYHKHIGDLTREDRAARIAAERETVAWLKERVEPRKRGEDAPPHPHIYAALLRTPLRRSSKNFYSTHSGE